MHAFTRLGGKALVGILMTVLCVILAGCKEEVPKPSTSGFYDGPMKPKASPGAPKSGTATSGSSHTAGEP